MRCRPSMRMSDATKGSNAWALAARQASSTRAAIRFIVDFRFVFMGIAMAGPAPRPAIVLSTCYQAQDIVVKSQAHQCGERGHADILPGDHGAFAQGAALDPFDEVIHQ